LHLPGVFVIINTCSAWHHGREESSPSPTLYKRGRALPDDSPGLTASTPSPPATRPAKAIEARAAGRPYLLEVVTERLRGPFLVDAQVNRSAEESSGLKHR